MDVMDISSDSEPEDIAQFTPPPPKHVETLSHSDDITQFSSRRDKGKGRADPLSPLALPAHLTNLPAPISLPTPIVQAQSETERGSSKLLFYNCLRTDCIILERNKGCLDIPFGDPDVLTSAFLNCLTLFFYKPLRILICIECQVAIAPTHLRKHLRTAPHNNTLVTSHQVNAITQELDVHPDDKFDSFDPDLPAIPGIPFEPGVRCSVQGCRETRTSMDTMGRHLKNEHSETLSSARPIETMVQVIFNSNQRRYPVQVPTFHSIGSTPPDAYRLAIEQANKRLHNWQHKQTVNDPSQTSFFYTQYPWHDTIADIRPDRIQSWIALPDEYPGLTNTIRLYYGAICERIKEKGLNPYYSHVLRLLKSR